MRIEHVAVWTNGLERLKDFYIRYFNGMASEKYVNGNTGFESYFIQFGTEARLELMWKPTVCRNAVNVVENQGIAHFSMEIGTRQDVVALTERMRGDGVVVLSEPRLTGDGYFESVIADPDGNRIELSAIH